MEPLSLDEINANLAALQFELDTAAFHIRCVEARRTNREICKRHRIYFGEERMTPQEELFAKFFNHEAQLVSSMGMLELRAHREELAQIAFEARARLTAIDKEESKRKSKGGPEGFKRDVNVDDTTSDAINAVKNRQKRLDKKEKVRQSLLDLGVDPAEVEAIMMARNIREQVTKPKAAPSQPEVTIPIQPIVNPETAGFVNPFIKAAEEKPVEEKPSFFVNPFSKE